MAITVNDLAFGYPGAASLFSEVSFKIDTGERAGLIGDNAVGKSTLLKVLAGVLEPEDGSVVVDGRAQRMSQSIGQHGEGAVTVREFLAGFAPPPVRRAALELLAAEAAHDEVHTEATGLRLASAVADWSGVAGYELESTWDACTGRVLRQPLATAGARPIGELSGGERKRLALEFLLVSDAEVLLLDEPDNFLDVPAKRWLEHHLNESNKTVLVISHDRELLSNAVTKLVTIEGAGSWVHGGSFAGYHDARAARNERLGDALGRWQQEERRLYRYYKLMKQRASISDTNAARADAAETRWNRFVAAGPPPAPPPERSVNMKLRGADSGRRVVRCSQLEMSGLTLPFSLDVYLGDRVAVLGPNGSGKSHFIRLLGGEAVDSTGHAVIGARVRPGMFVQTNERAQFEGRTPADVLAEFVGTEEATMRALARYGLQEAAYRDFSTLSGGQQARLQILSLELAGVNLLLLDEPTDNLDLVSAEALQEALVDFVGTVIAVTHDRWFMRSFDRFVLFELDGSIHEATDLETALALVTREEEFEPGPGSLVSLTSGG